MPSLTYQMNKIWWMVYTFLPLITDSSNTGILQEFTRWNRWIKNNIANNINKCNILQKSHQLKGNLSFPIRLPKPNSLPLTQGLLDLQLIIAKGHHEGDLACHCWAISMSQRESYCWSISGCLESNNIQIEYIKRRYACHSLLCLTNYEMATKEVITKMEMTDIWQCQ